jgi:hypothetical protein
MINSASIQNVGDSTRMPLVLEIMHTEAPEALSL